MLDLDIMRAIGRLAARQARTQAKEATANEVIDYVPLLEPWKAGTSESPVDYDVGDVRTYDNQPWKCVQTHTHHGEPGWEPGKVSMWGAYHATDATHALPWTKPTGAHDMYKTGNTWYGMMEKRIDAYPIRHIRLRNTHRRGRQ